MKIQKHTIFQISVPFDMVATEDEFIFSRYLLINCFSMDGFNYVRIEIEEIFDSKVNPSKYNNMRTVNSVQFEERELPGTLHVILGALSKNEITGQSEMTFLVTLFTEIMFQEPHLSTLKKFFPKWDVDDIIQQSKVPGQMATLLKMKMDIEETK